MVVRLNMLSKILSSFAVLIISIVLLICSNVYVGADSTESKMTPISYSKWESKRQQYLPNILVVDMWAMWCVSCIERFPRNGQIA